jgi:PAS domain S-box-containing protein
MKSGFPFMGYGISVLIVLGFMGIKLALGSWLNHEATYLLLGGASMLSAWTGGLGPGLLATVLAAIMTNLAFIPPYSPFSLTPPAISQLVLFLLEGGLIAWGTAALRGTRRGIAVQGVDLRQSEETTAAVVEAAAEGIVVTDHGGTITRVNRRLEEMFGYLHDELLGQPLELLVPERSRAAHVGHRTGYRAAPRLRSMGLGLALFGRRKDGTEFPVEVSLSFVPHALGGLAIAFVSDITQRVALERAARETEKFVALATFSSGIAHELNNPIGIMTSRIELLLMELPGEIQGSIREDLEVLQRNLRRVGRIAGGMLAFARQAPQEPCLLSLNTVVEDTLMLVRRQLERDGIQITMTFDPGLPHVFGDPSALEQVLMNLLINARDAMPQGGSIKIETARTSEPSGWIRLVVADTGSGISPEALSKIAEPFYTTKAVGTGLGLTVSYKIIQEHRGTISVQSELGQGTTFTILLPVQQRDA